MREAIGRHCIDHATISAAALAAYKAYVLSVPTLGLEDFTFEVDDVVVWTM